MLAGRTTNTGSNHRQVPAVDPGQLLEALGIVYCWAENDEDGWEWIQGEQLFDVLGRIRHALDVEPPVAIALFQRSLALFSFCLDTELADAFFDDGFPGRELCAAASKAPVLNLVSFDQGEISPYFDTYELQAAFRAALN
jgi:hypothetical protein